MDGWVCVCVGGSTLRVNEVIKVKVHVNAEAAAKLGHHSGFISLSQSHSRFAVVVHILNVALINIAGFCCCYSSSV